MRGNRKNSLKRERIIMITSSAFVLAALTLTGIYMGRDEQEDMNDGYTVDFTTLENEAEDKLDEIADNQAALREQPKPSSTPQDVNSNGRAQSKFDTAGDALDYYPEDFKEDAPLSEQVDSGEVENPVAGESVVVKELHFSEEEGLLRPVTGDILLPYSMDASIYFTTLDQYKYNPAVVYSAPESTSVIACAEGKVADIYQDAKLGTVMVLDLGDGYQATYGQLCNIQAAIGDTVDAGEVIAEINAPTKYYSLEGSNLYFMVTNDGESLNPESLIK